MTLNIIEKQNKILFIMGIICIPFICLAYGTEFIDYYYMKATGEWIMQNGIMHENPFFFERCDIIVQQWAYCIYIALISRLGKWGILFSETFFLFVYYFILTIFLKEYDISKTKSLFYFYISIVVSVFYLAKIRPEALTIILLLIEIYTLEIFRKTSNCKILFLLPITMLLEINFHGSMWIFHYVVIFPYLVPCFSNIAKNENLNMTQIKKLIPFIVMMTIVMFINPYGIEMIMYLPNTYLARTFNYVDIQEVESAKLSSSNGLVYLILVISFVFLIVKKKISSISFYFILGFLFCALFSIRNFMFLSIASIFLLIEMDLNINWMKLKTFKNDFKFINSVIVISIILLFIPFFVSSYLFMTNHWLVYNESKVFNCLESNAEKNDKIFSYFSDTSYLEFKNFNNVYIDSRPELYMKKINKKDDYLKKHYEIFEKGDSAKIKEFIHQEKFDFYLCQRDNDSLKVLIFLLDMDKKYKLLYQDEEYCLYGLQK